jgi:hypothetical protein
MLNWYMPPVRSLACALLAIAAIFTSDAAHAQLFRGGRLVRPPAEPGVEAIAGDPYGVGRWTVQMPAGTNPAILGNNTFTLTERNSRVRYQAFQSEPVRTALREIIGRPQTITIYFLFTGDGPLELELYAPSATTTVVTPQRDAVGQARLLTDWWVRFARQSNRIDRSADYPDLVDNYLLATLARRLNLPPAGQLPPPLVRSLADSVLGSITGRASRSSDIDSGDEELDRQIGLIFGGDSLRSDLQTQSLARRTEPSEPADQLLPAAFAAATTVPEPLGDVAIEPIAAHVPAECFYVRFGTFTNYMWCRRTMGRWDDDLRNLLNRRGLDYRLTARMERQISLKESVLSELLGPSVVADVAMVGSDLFFREGAAMGMLFQAQNNYALASDFLRQRQETLDREPGCSDKQVEIAGHKVSLLSTPDNRVRSFYAVDGDFHFVSNSERLIERFYEAGAGRNALGSSAEFRLARSLLPFNRDYSVFAYLSGQFFQNIVGPHYQIEMMRRLRSAAEIDMAMVALTAARSDGNDPKNLDDLIRLDYLPEGFAARSDGSKLEMTPDGQFLDTLRQARGSFLPVPDVKVDHVTATEARRYQQFATWLQAKWPQFDPVVAGIRRQPGKLPETEHITIDAQLTPLAAKNYSTIATALGPISKQRLAPVPGDLLAGEAVLSGNLLASKGLAQPQGVYRMFGALRDAMPESLNGGRGAAAPPNDVGNPATGGQSITINGVPLGGGQLLNNPIIGGLLQNPGAITSPLTLLPPFYFGAYPTPAIFAWLGVPEVPLDAAGYGRSPGGLWQRRDGRFTTASAQREVLEVVTSQFRFVDAPRPAQAWAHAGDLGHSKLAGLINGLFYRAAKSAAVGNIRFLHELNAQLRVPIEDCLKVAQQLSDAVFVDPLGGTYQTQQPAGGLSTWTSSTLPPDKMRLVDGLFDSAPANFTASVLDWLRGLDADVALDQRTMSLHVEVDMQNAGRPGAPRPAPNTPNSAPIAGPKLAPPPARSVPPQPKPAGARSEDLPTPPAPAKK